MARSRKVLLCGYYGMGNLGDELLLSSCLYLLGKNGIPRESTAVLSGSPQLTEKCYNITSVDRWDLREVFRACLDSETLLLGGGGIFQDSSSVKSVVYYWLVVRIARACGCRVWAVGQSAGPLSNQVSRALARNAFSSCCYIGVRDEHSRSFLGKRAVLAEDLVLSLPVPRCRHERDVLLVSFRRTPSGVEQKALETFADMNFPGCTRTIGVAMSSDDAAFMEDLRASGRLRLDEVVLPGAEDVHSLFARGRAAFGMRLHFGVLALKHGVPCTLVPYDPKVSYFSSRWGCTLWSEGGSCVPSGWKNAEGLEAAAAATECAFSEAVRELALV